MTVFGSLFNMITVQQRVGIVEIRRACIVVPNFTDNPFRDL